MIREWDFLPLPKAGSGRTEARKRKAAPD